MLYCYYLSLSNCILHCIQHFRDTWCMNAACKTIKTRSHKWKHSIDYLTPPGFVLPISTILDSNDNEYYPLFLETIPYFSFISGTALLSPSFDEKGLLLFMHFTLCFFFFLFFSIYVSSTSEILVCPSYRHEQLYSFQTFTFALVLYTLHWTS